MTEREERSIVRDLVTTPGLSLHSLAEDTDLNPKQASRRTLGRLTKQARLVAKTTAKGREISPKNKHERLNFAKLRDVWTVNEWSTVIFSDESDIFAHRTVSSVVWKRKGTEANQPYEKNLRKKTVKVWAFISFSGKRRIVRYEDTMNSQKYVEMLEEHLLSGIPEVLDQNQQMIFMQDNATAHTAKRVKDWFEEMGLNSLLWPAQSPDLNPIENVWSYLQNELWERRSGIRNVDDVWSLTQELFYNMDMSYIEKLYNSLPGRIMQVIKAKGNRITKCHL